MDLEIESWDHFFCKVHLMVVLCVRSLILSLLFAASSEAIANRPNVLFIVADDLNCKIGPYSDPVAVTPNLDRLAKRGLTFQRAYCQQTVCNPSRSSFLTGLRPDTIGVDDLRKYFRETIPGGNELITLPEHFKKQGYFCQDIGKIFHNMGETQDRQSWSIDEILYKGTHAADTIYFNQPAEKRKLTVKALVTEAEDVSDTVYRDGQIANLAAAMLKDHSSSQPFFLAVGFWRPHLPFVAPKKYWDMYDLKKIPLPKPNAKPRAAAEIAMHNSREIKGYGFVPKDRAFTEQEVRHYRHGYYASISFLDAQLGEILDALDQSPHADNTIIVFTSDHGFHVGELGLWGKTSHFELDARVPLIIASPKHKGVHGKTTEALAELVDLYPTLAELAGFADDAPSNLEGTSLIPVLKDPHASVKEAAFTQIHAPFYGPKKDRQAMGYSIRTQDYRYTEWRSIKDHSLVATELYDQSQGIEKQNLAEKGMRSVMQELAKQLQEQHAAIIASAK